MTREQHYVTFYSPGTFFAETSTLPIEGWDTKVAVGLAETVRERYNARPYGFRFETRIVADPVPDGRGGTLAVQPRTIKTSGMYHLGGTLLTLREVEARDREDERVLRSNMRNNDSPIVVVNKNSWRSTTPFNEGDVIVGPSGEVTEWGNAPAHVTYRREEKAKREAECQAS